MSDDRREKSLRDYLQFNPPPSVEQTPTSFTFSREHVLDLDWEKLLEEAGGFKLPAENAHLVRFLRRHFRGR